MEGILKHKKRPTVKIKSATIVTKNSIHILIVSTRRRKTTMATTRMIPVKKVKPVLKTCTKILRMLIIP